MPQIGNQKFPYTPAGMKRYQQIKKQIKGGTPPRRGPNDFKPGGPFARRNKKGMM